MTSVNYGMVMSLDGFVNDRNGDMQKLYDSYKPNAELLEEMERTGAVVMGRNTFETTEDTDAYADDYEFQVPLFVLTHQPPERHPKENENLTITFVTDGIESAIQQAKAAAKSKDVVLLGADVGQQALRAKLVDMVQVSIAPILLGKGLRMFDRLDDMEIQLEKVRIIETEHQVEIWYKVL